MYREIVMEKQANTGKIEKNNQRKTSYKDDDSREEADRMLAGNQRGRWH
jgi:hypothetical protein